MPEHQNEEYKRSWRDEYIKWVCGFANANGGTICIGKDDDGKVVGVENHKKLMEDLPNKIHDLLGVIAEVNLKKKDKKYYIEIKVPPYSVPISLRGRYYYRTGSTKKELTGSALNEFLLRKSGKTWDDVIEQRASISDIDKDSVRSFLQSAERAGRFPRDEELSLIDLMEKLRLVENGQMKRAAIVLFGKDPGKFYANMSVKMGRFGGSDDDLKFEEVEEGNLIYCLEEVLNQLNRKFLVKPIEFEGVHRIEKGEYPVAALREMLLNAFVHRNYLGSNIQIRVYDDKLCIWNEGGLPEGLSLESLKRQHPSRPRNPIIADVCFKGGYIDAWGRGILKIMNACKDAELPEPEIIEIDGGLQVNLFKNVYNKELLKEIGLNEKQIKAVEYVKMNGQITNREYRKIVNVSDESARKDLNYLVQKNLFRIQGKGRNVRYVLSSGD